MLKKSTTLQTEQDLNTSDTLDEQQNIIMELNQQYVDQFSNKDTYTFPYIYDFLKSNVDENGNIFQTNFVNSALYHWIVKYKGGVKKIKPFIDSI